MNSSEQNSSATFSKGILGAMFGVIIGTLTLTLVYILLNGKDEVNAIIKMNMVSFILALIGLVFLGGVPSAITGFIICIFQNKIYFNLLIGCIVSFIYFLLLPVGGRVYTSGTEFLQEFFPFLLICFAPSIVTSLAISVYNLKVGSK